MREDVTYFLAIEFNSRVHRWYLVVQVAQQYIRGGKWQVVIDGMVVNW